MTAFLEHWRNEFMLPLSNPVLVFSIILLIILLAPLFLRKLKIPGIIGLIISGVIIGPNGFHLLENNSAVDLFSTIGLLYIMFIAGLELDIAELINNRKQSLLFGMFTFIIPFAIGLPVCLFLLDLSMTASLLTAGMFSTHTMVAYPIMSKLGVKKNKAVAVTVGGTIITDTLVLLIIAFIISSSHGSLAVDTWIQLLSSLVIFSVIMFFFIPRITRWFFKKLESEKHSHYIFVLSVVFFAAFLAEVSGVEPIFGAFIAGLTLSRLIPRTSLLMNRIEFTGNSLFIPFFLVSVGLIVDLKLIVQGWWPVVIAIILTAVALLGKWIASLFTQLICKFSNTQGQLIFGLSSSHAAATLAIMYIGYKAGIIDEHILNGTIVLILITCVVAYFVTEKAAKKLALEKDSEPLSLQMDVSEENIVVASKNFLSSIQLVELARIIHKPSSNNPINLLTIIEQNGNTQVKLNKAKEEIKPVLEHAAATEARVRFVPKIDNNVSGGIIRFSIETMADLIIVDWNRNTGIFENIVGETLDSLIENSEKTLFVCNINQPLETIKNIVLLVPPYSELEDGFLLVFRKIEQMAQTLSLPVLLFGNSQSIEYIKRLQTKSSGSLVMHYSEFNDWQDFLYLSRFFGKEDLIIYICSRKGSISYMNQNENLHYKMEKYFRNYNKIIVYPSQQQHTPLNATYKDIDSEALEKGIETIQRIGKEIGNIFKKEG